MDLRGREGVYRAATITTEAELRPELHLPGLDWLVGDGYVESGDHRRCPLPSWNRLDRSGCEPDRWVLHERARAVARHWLRMPSGRLGTAGVGVAYPQDEYNLTAQWSDAGPTGKASGHADA